MKLSLSHLCRLHCYEGLLGIFLLFYYFTNNESGKINFGSYLMKIKFWRKLNTNFEKVLQHSRKILTKFGNVKEIGRKLEKIIKKFLKLLEILKKLVAVFERTLTNFGHILENTLKYLIKNLLKF